MNTFMKSEYLQPDRNILKEKGATHVVIGAPFEMCCIYRPGAGFGPQAIRRASEQFMTYNFDLDIDIADYLNLYDAGDADMIPGNVAKSHRNIENAVGEIVAAGATPILLGGDHSVPIPAVNGIMEHFKGKKLGLVMFDTHMDTADSYAGEKISNCTNNVRFIESGVMEGKNIAHIGIRGCLNPQVEWEFAREQGIRVFTSREVRKSGIDKVIREALDIAGNGTDGIYVSVDIDCLDPAYGPGTCAPDPTGLTSWELVDACKEIGLDPKVIAFDVCEVAPQYDIGEITARVACRAIAEYLGAVALRKRGEEAR
jgi:agmatinase